MIHRLLPTDGNVSLHSTVGRHWIAYINERQFDSYSCPPPKLETKNIFQGKKCFFRIQNPRKIQLVCCLLQYFSARQNNKNRFST